MAETAEQLDMKLALAKALVDHLESGNDEDAGSILAELAGFGDSQLFKEVGRLTRELHNAINSFVMDARIANIAERDMPDAAERLRYVITMTEQAANTTLNAVEDSLPLTDQLRSDAHRLSERWGRFESHQLSVDDFRGFSGELSDFLQLTQNNTGALHEKLEAVLMAQSYQDLTGQVIRKVINLVEDVEAKLVELVRLSGGRGRLAERTEPTASRDGDTSPNGPVVPGVDKADVVNGQDDVDDLLSSLGF